MPGRAFLDVARRHGGISMPDEPNFMCTGLVTVAPFFGSMKNTLAVAVAFAAGFLACALAKAPRPGDHHEDRKHELLADCHKRSPFRGHILARDGCEPAAAPYGFSAAGRGSSVSTRAADRLRKRSSAVSATSAIPRRRPPPHLARPRRDLLTRAGRALACSSSTMAGIERDGAADAHAQPARRVELARPGRSTPPPADRPRAPAPRRAARMSSGGGSISSVNGIARFWITVNASSSTARSLTMPKRSTVASQSALSSIVARRAAEHADVAGVGQRRAGGEVDEHFRRRLIEAEQRDRIARGDAQLCDPQRPQPAVVLGDPGEFEDRRAHEPNLAD